MTPKQEHTLAQEVSQTDFQELLQAKLREAVRYTLITVLEAEVEALIGAAPYQRTGQRRDHRNGHYQRDLVTGVGVIEAIPVPRTRKGHRSQLFERYQRRQAELDELICDMFVGGVSSHRVGEVIESLTGTKPSSTTVSRVFHRLEDEFTAWKSRPLVAEYAYAYADGTYFSVIYGSEGYKMPILAVIGITPSGEREVLAFSIGDRENQGAWDQLFEELKARGVERIGLWITDGHQAMLNALAAKFPTSQRQRCIKHKLENILSYLPKTQHDQVYPEFRAIFYQDNLDQAQQLIAAVRAKYEKIYPSALACLDRDLAACLTFYRFPKAHWKTIRTTNIIERLFGEVKKRSHKMAAAFRNENSCLLMFYAVIRSLKFNKLSMSTN